MFDPDDRQPIDATPPSAVPDAAGVDRPDGAPTDLAAVPSFLRSRLGQAGSGRPAANASTHGPRPATTSIPDVASLPMLGIAPRRLILLGASILLAWMIVSFGRQVAEASASSARAEGSVRQPPWPGGDRHGARAQVIQDQRYIGQAARAFVSAAPGRSVRPRRGPRPPMRGLGGRRAWRGDRDDEPWSAGWTSSSAPAADRGDPAPAAPSGGRPVDWPGPAVT
jgi:hypothetical protein